MQEEKDSGIEGKDNHAAGTKREPYKNDTGDPSTEEPHDADEDAAAGQSGEPGLPDKEEKEWSPGSGAES